MTLNRTSKTFLITGTLLLTAAVQLGALGAHALTETLSPQKLTSWNFAVQFQFYHGLGLILIAVLYRQLDRPALLQWAGGIMLGGIALFCGSIYAEALGAAEWLGSVAPVGGTSFMLAWLMVAIAALRS